MSKVLELEKRGSNFSDAERKESDLENFRLYLSFIDKDGIKVEGDLMRGKLFSYNFKNGNERVKPKLISEYGLFTGLQHETPDGCFVYRPKVDMSKYRYTKKDVLLFIQEVTGDYSYTDIKFTN